MRPNRFNGDSVIPRAAIDEFPNWIGALDEEGEDGQDESTIKPAESQASIVPYETAFTAGDARFSNGDSVPILMGSAHWSGTVGDLGAIRLLLADQSIWIWLTAGSLNRQLNDAFYRRWGNALPMNVESRLAHRDGKKLRFHIDADTVVDDQ